MKSIGKRKKLITAALMVGVMGFASLPLGASAQGNNNYNWQYQHERRDREDRGDRGQSWRAREVAQRHHPGRGILREDRYRNHNNDVIIIIIFVDGYHSYVRERDGAFLGQYYR